jgi:site-specific DNA-methyltransferase (adenine-specific)
MLSDKNMKILHDFNDEKECFTCVSIKGGVCYFLWDNEYNGNCEVINHVDGKIVSSVKRPLLEDDLDVFIRHNEAIPIFKKVMSKNEKSFNTIISSRKPFGLPTNFSEFKKNEFKGSIKIYNNQGERFVDRKHINKNLDWIDKYKIYIPKAIGGGDMSKDQLKPIMAGFNTCCTETYLVVGPFENKIETQNAYTYMKTKFFHFMLGLKKISQDTTSKVYQFVPLQNFTSDSDIDWSKSIKEIDQQLYTKYGLSSDEIDFIESKIKPMS